MHTKSGVQEYADAVEEIKKQGGKIAFGGKVYNFFFCMVSFNFLWLPGSYAGRRRFCFTAVV